MYRSEQRAGPLACLNSAHCLNVDKVRGLRSGILTYTSLVFEQGFRVYWFIFLDYPRQDERILHMLLYNLGICIKACIFDAGKSAGSEKSVWCKSLYWLNLLV